MISDSSITQTQNHAIEVSYMVETESTQSAIPFTPPLCDGADAELHAEPEQSNNNYYDHEGVESQ